MARVLFRHIPGKLLAVAPIFVLATLLASGTYLPPPTRALAAELDSPTPTAGYPQLYELYKPPLSNQGMFPGTSNPSLFGPAICATYGDPNVPSSPTYSQIGGKYTYRIAIPSDYSGSQVRVELFDPDTGNKSTTPGQIFRLSGAASTAPACGAPFSTSNPQANPCMLPTTDTGNPWWNVRVDENRGNGTTTCFTPTSYVPAQNTRTLYRLYYYDAYGNQVDLAYYVGKDDDPAQAVLPSSSYTPSQARTEGLATDLMWVSPGAPSGSRLPAMSNVDGVAGLNSAAEPATLVENCNAARTLTVTNSVGTFEVSGAAQCQGNGDFIINLASEAPGLAADTNGAKNLYLDIRSLSGGSENNYDIWAGPPTAGLPSDVNARNVLIGRHVAASLPNPADTGGTQIYAQQYESFNSDATSPVNVPLTYIGPEYAGMTIATRVYDLDTGTVPPIVFYLDTVPKTTWAACYGTSSSQCITAGASAYSYMGAANIPANGLWNTYTFTIPSTVDGLPFAGGNLMASYTVGIQDTFVWNISGGPPLPPVLSTPADNATVVGTTAYSWLASGTSGASVYQFEYDDDNDFSSPVYVSGNLTGLSLTPPGQAPGTYHWRVRAYAFGHWGFWSNPRTVTILLATPTAPLLVSPEDVTLTDDTTPAFTWASALRADNYTIEISSATDFSSSLQSFTTTSGELTYTSAPLAEGVYYWRVRGVNAAGPGPWSGTRSFRVYTSAPSTPANFRATAQTMATITLAWDDTTTETGFRVERSPDGVSDWTLVGSTGMDILSLGDSGLACGTQTYYHVQAFNLAGDSAFTDPLAISTLPCLPAAPDGLTATAFSQSQVDLEWVDNSNNESGFKVERSPAGQNSWTLLTTTAADATTYSDTTTTCGTGYDYRVTASNVSGDSAASDPANMTTDDCNPGAPSGLNAATISQTQIDLSWTDNTTGEEGFRIERSPAGQNTWTTIGASPADAVGYSDEAVVCGTGYDYQVRAFTSGGTTGTSDPASATTVVCNPAAPSGLSALVISRTQVNLLWTDNSNNETDFKVERSPAGQSSWTLIATLDTNATTYTDTTAICGASYDYLVKATNAGGDSAASNVSSVTLLSCSPAAPSGLSATGISQTQVQLHWSDNSSTPNNEEHFNIERYSSLSASWELISTTTPDQTTFTDTGLSCGTSYNYRVNATIAEYASDYSNAASNITVACAPIAPSALTANGVSKSQVDLSWTDNSDNETGFKIQQSANGGSSWSQVATVGAGLTTYQIQSVPCGSTYFFRVIATNAGGDSAPSNAASATTVICIPAAPSLLTATPASRTQINLAWSDNSTNETGFKVQRSPDGTNSWVLIATTAANQRNYSDTNVSCGSYYYYRVIATNAGGDSSPAGPVRGNPLPCVPADPTGLTATPFSQSSVILRWTDNSGSETGFKIERSPNGQNVWTLIHTTTPNIPYYTDSLLPCSTTFDYRVTATNAGGDSAHSNVASGATETCNPGAPTGLTASAFSLTQINLAWTDNSNDEIGFEVERSLHGLDSWVGITFSPTNQPYYSDTSVICGTTYDYRVAAHMSQGHTATSNVASATTLDCTVATPSGLSATPVSATRINLVWTDNSNTENGFRVERSLAGLNSWTVLTTTAVNIAVYSDITAVCSTGYDYRVTATGASGDSGPSNVASATTWLCPPATPSELSATAASQTQVNLTWTNNSGDADGFIVERSVHEQGLWTVIDSVATAASTYSDLGGSCETSYDYRVTMTNAGGSSGASNVANATTLLCSPAAPTDLNAAAASQTQVDLTWTDNSDDESGFQIEQSPFGENDWEVAASVPGGSTDYSDEGLTCGARYDYRVAATNSGGASAPSNVTTGTTAPCPPVTPSDLNASMASRTQINLSWTDNSAGNNGFKVEQSLHGQNQWALIAVRGPSVTAYSDTSLTCATGYDYRVTATNAGGDSSPSNIASSTTLDCNPYAPSGLTATAITRSKIDLAWADNSDDEDSFKIERALAGSGNWALIQTTEGDVTTYSDTTVVCGKNYDYRVMASSAAGDSGPSDTATATTAKCLTRKPAQPVITSPAKTIATADDTPSFAWKVTTNAATYRIQISRNATFTQLALNTVTDAPAYTAAHLDDRAYYVCVRGVNSLGVSGDWSAARKFTVDTAKPKAPNVKSLFKTKGRPSITVSTSAGAVKYIFQLSPYGDFHELTVKATIKTTTYTVPASKTLSPGSYYWRVAAVDAAGNVSDWSSVWMISFPS